MVPFSAFATSRWKPARRVCERYNGYSAVKLSKAAPGSSTGTAMDVIGRWCISYRAVFGWNGQPCLTGNILRRAGARAVRYFAISRLPVSGGIV